MKLRRSEILTLFVVLFVLAYIAHDALGPRRGGLPAAVQERITRHDTTRVVDMAAVHRLEREKAASRARELAAAAAGRLADSIAKAKGHEADSLADVARSAQTAGDSAAVWQQAYEKRSRQAEQLESSRDSARAETREVRAQLDSTERQSGIWKRRAIEGDSIIADLRPLAAEASRRWRPGIAIGYGCSDRGCGPTINAGATYSPHLPKLSLPFHAK